jgi:glycosyltransferase involved in cell wall biosynthesis
MKQRLALHAGLLAVAGGRRPQFAAEQRLDGLRLLGHVDDTLLPGLYAGAEAAVVPSLHEGFGLTCLEAMACGVPVVAANAGALPETCGDAATYVDPTDPDAIADGVRRALGNEALREAGPRRARAYGWDRTVRELDALMRS